MLEKNIKTTLCMIIMFSLVISSAVSFSLAPPVSAATTAFYPTEINDVLYNPYMGWVPWATTTSYSQNHTMVYAALSWKELEPNARGTYNWADFESKNNFSYWRSKGVKINIRFIMDTPTSVAHRDIPDWLYNSMGSNKGTVYNASIGQGFSPNYNDSYLISEHKRVIQALGERYKNDSSIAFIQLGSLGHWGEWHCWPYSPSTGTFPSLNVSNQYVQHYIDVFPTDKLTMRRGYQMAKDNGFGLFNDMFGDTASLDSSGWGWLWQINNGYTDDIGQSQPSMPDFWKSGPAGGEFANGNAAQYLASSTINETIRQAQISHTSWLGPCTPASMASGCPEQANLDRLMKTMGYRFVLTSVSHNDTATKGSSLSVTMNWNNKGVAPFYFNWPVELSLADSSGNIVSGSKTQAAGIDIRNWLPGTNSATASVKVPSDLASGTYKLCVAILDPATDNPAIKLAIDGKRSDGRYTLGNVVVSSEGSTPSPTPSPVEITIDGNASDWNGITPIATASGQTAATIKVTNDANYLYFCVQGENLGAYYELFLDTDNNSSTGYVEGTWNSTGIDYMIENGTLYKSTGRSWAWSSLGTSNVFTSKNASVCELRIARSALTGLNSTIKIGFKDITSGWALACRLPATGTLPTYTLQ